MPHGRLVAHRDKAARCVKGEGACVSRREVDGRKHATAASVTHTHTHTHTHSLTPQPRTRSAPMRTAIRNIHRPARYASVLWGTSGLVQRVCQRAALNVIHVGRKPEVTNGVCNVAVHVDANTQRRCTRYQTLNYRVISPTPAPRARRSNNALMIVWRCAPQWCGRDTQHWARGAGR